MANKMEEAYDAIDAYLQLIIDKDGASLFDIHENQGTEAIALKIMEDNDLIIRLKPSSIYTIVQISPEGLKVNALPGGIREYLSMKENDKESSGITRTTTVNIGEMKDSIFSTGDNSPVNPKPEPPKKKTFFDKVIGIITKYYLEIIISFLLASAGGFVYKACNNPKTGTKSEQPINKPQADSPNAAKK